MSAHVLLNLLNALRKSDKMSGFGEHFFTFCNKLNKFNNTQTLMSEFFYHMPLNLL